MKANSRFARWLVAGLLVMPLCWQAVSACPVRASYRSVVLNTAPAEVPEGATLFRLEVRDALIDRERGEIQGIRGPLVDASGGLPTGTIIQVTGRAPSMCDTWIEHWSGDHDVTDGVLTGFMVGKVIGMVGDTYQIRPMLFRTLVDRGSRGQDGIWMYERSMTTPTFDPRRIRISKDAEWAPMRVDPDAIAFNIAETDRLIREGLEWTSDD